MKPLQFLRPPSGPRRPGIAVSEGAPATASKKAELRGACGFCRGEWAGSAKNTWFSGGCARKSLILEASAATSLFAFAMSLVAFATSPVFRLAVAASFPLSLNY